MKLYYSAGSCSTSCHIVLEESGLKYEAIEIDWDNANDPNLEFVKKSNPMGTLPIFITDDGKQLDQNIAIHAYISDHASEKKLLPPAGTLEYAQAWNWLSFVAADLHKSIGALFGIPYISPDKGIQETVRKYMLDGAHKSISYVEGKLAGKDYLMGKAFTAADAYAFIVLSWTQYLNVSIEKYPNVQAYLGRIAARPAVAKVMKDEGLI